MFHLLSRLTYWISVFLDFLTCSVSHFYPRMLQHVSTLSWMHIFYTICFCLVLSVPLSFPVPPVSWPFPSLFLSSTTCASPTPHLAVLFIWERRVSLGRSSGEAKAWMSESAPFSTKWIGSVNNFCLISAAENTLIHQQEKKPVRGEDASNHGENSS